MCNQHNQECRRAAILDVVTITMCLTAMVVVIAALALT